MLIKYTTSEYKTETRELEIEDTKNVFLQGTNPYDGLPTYFGIWQNKGTPVIVTIISWRTINYKRYLSTAVSPECDIKDYLNHNIDVKNISRDEFKKEISNIQKILEI